MMTHSEARERGAGASRAPSSAQHRLSRRSLPSVWQAKGEASRLQNSTRNKPTSRIRHNSPDLNHLIFSTRNKIGGSLRHVVHRNDRWDYQSHCRLDTPLLAASPISFAPFQLPASSLEPPESNRYNPGNRNRRNSPAINNINFSNRYKMGGSRHYVSQPRTTAQNGFCAIRDIVRWVPATAAFALPPSKRPRRREV